MSANRAVPGPTSDPVDDLGPPLSRPRRDFDLVLGPARRAATTFCSTWAAEDVPGIGAITGERCRSQANDTCAGLAFSSAAMRPRCRVHPAVGATEQLRGGRPGDRQVACA